MKKYLWTIAIVSVLTPNIYAKENPFELQENFQKIDKNVDDLIESLKKIYNKRKDKKQVNVIPKVIIEESFFSDKNTTVLNTSLENNVTDVNMSKDEEQISDEDIVEINTSGEKSKSNVDNDEIFRKALEEQKALVKFAEEERLEKVRQEKEKIDIKIEAEKKHLEQERQALEKEKEKKTKKDLQKDLERKVNTTKEAKKLSIKIVDTNITQDEQDADRTTEKAFLKATKDVEEKNSIHELENNIIVVKEKKEIETVIDKEKKKIQEDRKQVKIESEYIVDINITKEELEALKKADEALLRAMEEVN